jgi:hypothetical protein
VTAVVMALLILAESIKAARPLPDASLPIYVRSFRTQQSASDHRFTFLPTARALAPGATPAELSSGVSFEHVPPERRDTYALVLNLGSVFRSIDEMAVERILVGAKETALRLALTRVESEEGEPALVDVFLILPLTAEITRTHRIKTSFSVRRRSQAGEVTELKNAIRECVVKLTGQAEPTD